MLTLIFGILLFGTFLIFVKRGKKLDNGSRIAAGQGVPLLGNGFHLMKMNWSVKKFHPSVYMLEAGIGTSLLIFQNEDLFEINFGPLTSYTMTKAKSVEALLKGTKFLNKPDQFRFLDPWIGTSIATSKKSDWKFLRAALTPSFHSTIMDVNQPIIFEKTEILIQILKRHLDGKPFDIGNLIKNCTLDIISETAMGCNLDAQRDENCSYVRAINELCRIVFQRFSKLHLYPDFMFNRSKIGRKFADDVRIVQTFIKKIFAERKSALLSNQSEEMSDRRPFLDTLLKKHILGEISEQQVIDQVNSFMFAGQDTSSSAATFSLFLIGQHPEVQAKIANELSDVFGDDKGPITMEHCKKLNYLECCFKESLRLYPSLPTIARKLEEDLHYDGKVLKKGSMCHAFIQVLHKDPNVFPNPETFDPDRFLPENCVGRHPFAYIPFSAGPRNCLGKKFAMIEGKTILANVLRHFEITSMDHVSKIPILPEIISKPALPIYMTVRLI